MTLATTPSPSTPAATDPALKVFTSQTLDVVNPTTAAVFTTVPASGPSDLDGAVDAARAGSAWWGSFASTSMSWLGC
jgi:acyl-CoA reductase-like NAD-dependent aldehyde dehydrogenase